MKHISLNISKEIKHILPTTLEKDLQDNEIICPTCHGLGVIKRRNPFGLREKENDKYSKINWYDNECLSFCPNCYNGIVKLCKYCGKPIEKGYIEKCDCEQYKEIEHQKALVRYQELINKAEEVKEEDLKDINTMLYYEEHDKYYLELEDFIDEWDNDLENLPQVLWVCFKTDISIDADNVIERACDDLHEDASENCDYGSLQKLLDDWCNEQTGTETHYPCYKEYIKVKKEWFD